MGRRRRPFFAMPAPGRALHRDACVHACTWRDVRIQRCVPFVGAFVGAFVGGSRPELRRQSLLVFVGFAHLWGVPCGCVDFFLLFALHKYWEDLMSSLSG